MQKTIKQKLAQSIVRKDLRFNHGGVSFRVIGPSQEGTKWRVQINSQGFGWRRTAPKFSDMEEARIIELVAESAADRAERDMATIGIAPKGNKIRIVPTMSRQQLTEGGF